MFMQCCLHLWGILRSDGVFEAIFNGIDVLLVVVLDATTKKITNALFNKST